MKDYTSKFGLGFALKFLNCAEALEPYEYFLIKSQVKINKNFLRKIGNIFLPITFSICFGYSKEPSQCIMVRHISFDVLIVYLNKQWLSSNLVFLVE